MTEWISLIGAAVNELQKEASADMPDVEASWTKFQAALKEKQNKPNRRLYLKLALAVSIAAVLLLSTQSEKVTAFKNEVFQWIGTNDQGTVITEVENPGIEPGTYEGLSFEDAQEMTLFHLLRPEYLPAGITPQPEIEIEVIEYPLLSVKMQYEGEQGEILLFSQEKTTGNMRGNTFVPENVECREITLTGKNVVFINAESTIVAKWTEHGIHYNVATYRIEEEDVLKVIENLK